MEIYLNGNFGIEKITDDLTERLIKGSRDFDLLKIYIPTTLKNSFTTIYPLYSVKRADGRELGPYATITNADTSVTDYYGWTGYFNSRDLSVEGALEITLTFFINDSIKKTVAKVTTNVAQAVEVIDDIYMLNDSQIYQSLLASINHLATYAYSFANEVVQSYSDLANITTTNTQYRVVVLNDSNYNNNPSMYQWNGSSWDYKGYFDWTQYLDDKFDTYKTELDGHIDERLNQQDATIAGLGRLHPSGVDTSTNILAKASDDGIWIGSDTGNWYYWDANSSQYVSGGVYQATEIIDGTVLKAGKIMASTSDVEAPYNDCNTFPKNFIVTIIQGGLSISNKPFTSFTGTIITMADNLDAVRFQIASSYDNTLYTRRSWGGTWSQWQYIYTPNNKDEIIDNSISGGIFLASTSDIVAPYDNVNTFPNFKIIFIVHDSLAISNKPTTAFNGTILTYSDTGGNVKTQIATSSDNNMYIRKCWGSSWDVWKCITKDNYNILLAYNNLFCAGDSLTYSQVYTGESTSRQAFKPYPSVLQDLVSRPVYWEATPGYSAINWWNAYNGNITQRTNQLAIIYLGTNEGLTDTLATDAPASENDYNNWSNTNTGCYAKIVAKCKSVGMKVLLLKVWATSGSMGVDVTNSVIEQIGSRFGCAVADSINLSDMKYHYYPDLSGYNGVHYNDLGYSAFADELIKRISNLDNDQMKLIIPE